VVRQFGAIQSASCSVVAKLIRFDKEADALQWIKEKSQGSVFENRKI